MPDWWTLGGLSAWELGKRTAFASWKDDVFGQGGRMAFYEFLTIFPAMVVLFTLRTRFPLGRELTHSLRDVSSQVFPPALAGMLQSIAGGMNRNIPFGLRLLSVCAGAIWAAHNGTWAMIYGLNRAYEVEERRSWWRLTLVIVGITASLMVVGCAAVLVMLGGRSLATHLHGGLILTRIFEWIVLLAALSLSFAILYRFAPHLRTHEWRWSTPGTVCAIVLWVLVTLLARLYFGHVNDYSRSYGALNGVAMLLLWLFAANGAILIGGEMNSEIVKELTRRGDKPTGAPDPSLRKTSR